MVADLQRQRHQRRRAAAHRRASNRRASGGEHHLPGRGAIAGTAVDDRDEPYRTAVKGAGLPCIVFSVDDIEAEYERLRGLGVHFTQGPQEQGPVVTAVLDDTVGNLVQLAQPKE